MRGLNHILNHIQRRQLVAVIIKAYIAGLVKHHSPCAYEIPKRLFCMAFQPPIRCRAAIMDEIHGQHFVSAHNIQKLRMVANLRGVVGAGCRRASQLVRGTPESINQSRAGLTLKILQYGTFIEYDTTETRYIDILQIIVVGDENVIITYASGGFVIFRHLIPEFVTLLDGLTNHGKRRKYQDAHFGLCCNLLRPFKLLDCLTQSAILK